MRRKKKHDEAAVDVEWSEEIVSEKEEEASRYLQRPPEKKQIRKKSPAVILLWLGGLLVTAGMGVLIWYLAVSHRDLRQRMDRSMHMSEVDWESAMAPETEPDPVRSFAPHCVDSTRPENLISYTEVEVNGTLLPEGETWQPWYHFRFGRGEKYTDVPGMVTFRGNTFRNAPAFGETDFTGDRITDLWTQSTGGLTYGNATWTGSGWTGQPLIATWPKQVRAHMNMYDQAKEKEELTEVIYACMDGYVYFLDLETGEKTRDSLYLGFTFKGSGALDPRGYPILYVGAGYDSNEGRARVFIINLLDCSTMYTFGNDDPFSLRGNLSYFDSSAVVDAASDTLIYPGENGILYLIRLGTQYDPAAGTLSINPSDVVKWHYMGNRTSISSYWVGMETSAALYGGYMFIADNGANLMCLDLNTLKLVWVQDLLDDSNSTPVLALEDGHLYIYVSTSFHLGWRSSTSAPVPIWKIDAETGEIIWQRDYECYSQEGVSGGVQSTIALGKDDLEDYMYATVSRTGDQSYGVLACIERSTGEVVWEHRAIYAWSSPVCVYRKDGKGRVLYCSCDGNMYLLDGKNGEVLDTFTLSNGAIEASPAVYNNKIVVGTRACQIWGLELK